MSDTPSTHLPHAADRANTFPWPPVLIAAAFAAAIFLGSAFPLNWPGMDDRPAHIIGLGIGAAGLALIGAAVAALRRHGTTVMPDRMSTALVTTGPYRLLRNPIYLGEVMVMFGLAEWTHNIWFVACGLAFAVLVTLLQVLPEERHLEARFGEDYSAYKARARRWI